MHPLPPYSTTLTTPGYTSLFILNPCSRGCYLFTKLFPSRLCTQLSFPTSSAVRCDPLTQSGQCNVGKVMLAVKLATQSPSFLFTICWLIRRLCGQRKMWKELGAQNDYLEQNTCFLTTPNRTEMKWEKSTFFIVLSHWELGVCVCVLQQLPHPNTLHRQNEHSGK